MNFRTVMVTLLVAAGCAPGPAQKNRDVADAVLLQTGAPDFVNASTEARAAVQHEPSGMLCILPRDGAFDMGVFPPAAANPGAYCSVANGQTASSFVVVRFSGPVTLDSAFQEATATTAGRVNARPWAGRASEADLSPPQGLPHYRIARFEADMDGAPHYLRVAVSEARGWYLQQVVSAPIAEAEATEAAAGEEWRNVLAAF